MEHLYCTPVDSEQPVERRKNCLSEEDIEMIAEKAAEKAITKLTAHLYQEIGKSFVEKFLYLLGATVVGVYLFLKSKGLV
jgi:hypothetical protein